MKKRFGFAAAVWWIAICFVVGIFLLISSDKDGRVSETENRMLAGLPAVTWNSVISAEAMEGLESFFTDAFPARDTVISFTNRLLGLFNVQSSEEKAELATAGMETSLAEEGAMQATESEIVSAAAEAAETVSATVGTEEDLSDEGEESNLVLTDSQMLTAEASYLWLKKTDGTNKVVYTYEADKIATYAETLKIILNYLPEDGQVYWTLVPLASIANRWEDNQSLYCGWGSSAEDMLAEYLQGESRIHLFNTMSILEPYVLEGKMFYHTDHHWTAEGAYKVLSEMVKSQNMPLISYSEYDYVSNLSKTNEDGEQDTFNLLNPLLPVVSTVVTQLTDIKELKLMNYGVHTYTGFMNNSRRPWRRIFTGADTGRKCLVLCDSFGNAFTPYLLAYYDEVHMADFRYGYWDKEAAGGSIGELMKYYGIDDVYIVNCTANGLRKQNSLIYLRQYITE